MAATPALVCKQEESARTREDLRQLRASKAVVKIEVWTAAGYNARNEPVSTVLSIDATVCKLC